MRVPPWVRVAKAPVACDHIGSAFLNGTILAVPCHVACAKEQHRTPGIVLRGATNRNTEAYDHRKGDN